MLKNKKTLIRVVGIILSCIISVVMYLSSYNIDESNKALKLSESINVEKVMIIDVYEIGVSNQIVFFETENSTGISLLNKGINKKFQINDIVQTDKKTSKVSYIVSRTDYSITYGKSSNMSSKSKNLNEATDSPIGSDSNYTFSVTNSRGVRSNYGSSWKTFTTPLRSILILIIGLLLSSTLSKKYSSYSLSEYNDMPLDGQRIKQGRPW